MPIQKIKAGLIDSYGSSNGQVLLSNGTYSYWANSTILSVNNSTNLGGTAAASYVQNTDSRTLSGNLIFSGANVVFSGGARFSGGVIANGSLGTAGQILASNGTSVYWTSDQGANAITANTLTANFISAVLYTFGNFSIISSIDSQEFDIISINLTAAYKPSSYP